MANEEMLTSVTSEQWGEVLADLEPALKLSQKNDESLSSYADRLAKKGNKLSDEAWDGLTEMAQLWINGALTAIELGNPLPVPQYENTDSTPPPVDEPEVKQAKVKKRPPADRTRYEPEIVKEKRALNASIERTSKATSQAGKSTGKRGRLAKLPLDAKVKVLVDDNPHREGCGDFAKFKLIKDDEPVSASIEAGLTNAYLRYGVKRGFLKVGD